MIIEIFSLCEAASVEGGKLSILSAFDIIKAKKVPFVFPQCAISLRVRFKKQEAGIHEVRVNFMGIDGKHVMPNAQGKIKVEFKNGQESVSANLILNLQRIKFDNFGEYSINLSIDGVNMASLPLFVREKPPAG